MNLSFSYTQVKVLNHSDLHFGEELGAGGYGIVYKGKLNKDQMAVAIKAIHSKKSAGFPPKECQIWSSVPSHENIIEFIGVAQYKVENSPNVLIYIVTELAMNGSLNKHLYKDMRKPTSQQSLTWASHVACGMKHLHGEGVSHRDLKSDNVLLTEHWVAKLCDFGTALELTSSVSTNKAGTCRWMPPEIIGEDRAKINKQCDLYSYGMILFELFAHEVPYKDLNTDYSIMKAVIEGKRPQIPSTLPLHLHDLLKRCWEKDPSMRPTFDYVFNALQHSE